MDPVILASYLALALFGALFLRAALEPAFRLAGARSRETRKLAACALASAVWSLAIIAAIAVTAAIPRDEVYLHGAAMLAVYVPAAVLLAAILARVAPLPGAMRHAAFAGVAVALAASFARSIDYRWTEPAPRVIAFGADALFPLLALYHSARRQRRLLKRYEHAGCPNCGYEGGAAQFPCPECGTHTHLCWNCRRFVNAAPGAPCPNCNAKIAARCWNCDAEWTDKDSDRCTSCSMWKPESDPAVQSGEPEPR